MEADSQYFDRKRREVALIAKAIGEPVAGACPGSIEELLDRKLQLAAQLKAKQAIAAWRHTETCSTSGTPLRAGPFSFSYRYQRADLATAGPLPYDRARLAGADIRKIAYTCSGMAAIAAVLVSIVNNGITRLVCLEGAYKETIELVRSFVPGLVISELQPVDRAAAVGTALWLDAIPVEGSLADAVEECARSARLIILDTTCFSARSRRIGRFLDWARRCGTAVVLVRSHTKLDTLGVEYGRLGSVMLLSFPDLPLVKRAALEKAARRLPDAVRLLGSAAIPAHFCPFIGDGAYPQLYASRCASLLRNGRRLVRRLIDELGAPCIRQYEHGMFACLVPPIPCSGAELAEAAEQLAAALDRKGLAARHAGSFGFDFVAVESFFDTGLGRDVLRVAAGDVPFRMADEIGTDIASWWSQRWRRRAA